MANCMLVKDPSIVIIINIIKAFDEVSLKVFRSIVYAISIKKFQEHIRYGKYNFIDKIKGYTNNLKTFSTPYKKN